MFISCLKLGDGNVYFNSLYDSKGKRESDKERVRGEVLFPFCKLQVLLKMSYRVTELCDY